MRSKSVVIDTTHGLIRFPHLTMHVKTTSSETTAKPQPVITDDAPTIPPTTTKTITDFVDHPSEWNTTGTVTTLETFSETKKLLTSHSMSTLLDKRIAVRVTSTKDSPRLIKKNTRIAEFSVVTPEQSKHFKPVYMAILSMIPQGDPVLTAHLNELLRMNKLEQQNNSKKKKTQSKREHRIPLQIPQTTWLDWHTSDANRETSLWRFPGWLPEHFGQTQNGYWDEHGIRG